MNTIEVFVEVEGKDAQKVALDAEATVEALIKQVDSECHETLALFIEGREGPLERHHKLHQLGIRHHHHVRCRRREVTITINGVAYPVRAGTYSEAELRNIPNPKIPADETLSEMVHGVPKPLSAHEPIRIRGGEIFASNVPSGGGS